MQHAELTSSQGSEKVLLDSVMLDNELFYLAETLRAEDFQMDYHRKIWAAIKKKAAAGEAFDQVVLANQFAEEKSVQSSGVADYLFGFNSDFTTKAIEPHVTAITRTAHRRRIVSTLESALSQARDLSEDNANILATTQDRLTNLYEHVGTRSYLVGDLTEAVISHIEKVADRQVGMGAFTTAIPGVDEKTSGLRLKEYIVVGAYTGEGKTSYILQLLAENCNRGAKALLFSQEMPSTAIVQRLIPIAASGIEASKVRNPRRMNGTDRAILRESKAIIDKWKFWINDTSSFHVSDLVAHAHMMVRKHGVQLIIVDYLQLLKADGEKRYDQVSNASAALRNFAKSKNVTVVVVSQLSRPDGKIKRRPSIFDLLASGQIEQDANLILFPYRPVDKQGTFTGEDEIVIAKQREGQTGIVEVSFLADRLMFGPRAGAVQPALGTDGGWWDK